MADRPDAKPETPPWPGTVKNREELDRALEAGEESGVSRHSIAEIVARVRARLTNG